MHFGGKSLSTFLLESRIKMTHWCSGKTCFNALFIKRSKYIRNMHQGQDSEAKVILHILKQIKSQKKGQNLENVVSQCSKELSWDRSKVLQAIELATTEGLISQFGKEKEQVSLRILDKGHGLLTGSPNRIDTTPNEQDMGQTSNCSLGSDYLEFKRHMFTEILSLKERINNKEKSVSEENG